MTLTIRFLSGMHAERNIDNAGGDTWRCRCGAPRCRGVTGTSFFELPLSFQREYLPLLAPWFRARFAERIQALENA